MADWMSKWQRSPRQDRRTIVNGKFVELTEPIIPEVKEEQPESALEVVNEPVVVTPAAGVLTGDGISEEEGQSVTTEETDVDGEFKISPVSDDVDKAFEFLNIKPSVTSEEITPQDDSSKTV